MNVRVISRKDIDILKLFLKEGSPSKLSRDFVNFLFDKNEETTLKELIMVLPRILKETEGLLKITLIVEGSKSELEYLKKKFGLRKSGSLYLLTI